ncbi:MAG: TetR/AcrR family transcriptional regulator [candidate division Zixibacteria bacterium]|nr:TetR/AcrR family transcriptional regulator [candidate division Zixibacteria bacterium]
MVIYYSVMRVKDEIKQEALFEATVKVVNETGFAQSSVSKIAKEAGISPATLYIYYKNKEDLLVSTYVQIKQNLSTALLVGFDDSRPIRDILKRLWTNAFHFGTQNRAYFEFVEQFSNSPYAGLVNSAEVEEFFEPLARVMQRGIDEKILKDVPFEVLTVFVFYPAMLLSSPKLCAGFEINEGSIDQTFDLAWDAIRL